MITRTDVTFLLPFTGNSDNGFSPSQREEKSSPIHSEELPFNLSNSGQYCSTQLSTQTQFPDPTPVKQELHVDNLRATTKFTTQEEHDKGETLKRINGQEGSIPQPTESELVSAFIDSNHGGLLSNGVPKEEESNQLCRLCSIYRPLFLQLSQSHDELQKFPAGVKTVLWLAEL